MSNTVDCREAGCPGEAAFVQETWLRPLLQMIADLERYEALLLKVGEWMDSKSSWDDCGEIARLLSEEARQISAKQKKEGRTDEHP